MFPPLSVSMCKHLLATRGKSLAEQFCFDKFPEHMVFMFSSRCCIIIRLISQSVACFGAKLKPILANRGTAVGGGGRSYSGVHRNLVSKVCRVVTRSVHEGPLKVHFSIQRVAMMRIWIPQGEMGASSLDLCETFVVQMKDLLSMRCVF